MHYDEVVKPPPSGTEEVSPLLPVTTTERLKEMAKPWGRPSEAQQAASELRRKQADDARKLADAVRREQLRQIPAANRTAEEQREFRRLEQRRYRAKESKGNVLRDVQTAEDFWRANRLLANPRKIREWKQQEERVLDQMFWMQKGWAEAPHSPDFVPLDDGLTDLEHFVTTHGLIHDDPFIYRSYELRDFRPAWGVWAHHEISAGIWGFVAPFFKDPERLKALSEENQPTAVYAKYGIRTALGACAVRVFKQRIAQHSDSTKLGWETREEHEKKCWLCNFERLHGRHR